MVGLVLAGGQSRRMGRDKGELIYHQLNQREHCQQLLSNFVEGVYISCNAEQAKRIVNKFPTIVDQQSNGGAIVGIVTAYIQLRKPMLVMAVDMPLIEKQHIESLLEHRELSKDGTLYINQQNFYEPLFAIWEVSGLEKIKKALDSNQRRLQNIISAMQVNTIKASTDSFLQSYNSKPLVETLRQNYLGHPPKPL